ncbi:cytidine deaminase-like protein [Phlyctochytrium arcticum]|nr:cytidine deaminase-like protein [Phlyctochytrium arcticum]
MSSIDREYMLQAIAEANHSVPVPSAYCVGAILVSTDDKVLSTGFSRELPGNTHAEECCLLKLGTSIERASGATIYTTMEPCGERLSGNRPCAKRLVEANVKRVVVGIPEPPNFIVACQGTVLLREKGIIVDYLDGFEELCLAPNKHIVELSHQSP